MNDKEYTSEEFKLVAEYLKDPNIVFPDLFIDGMRSQLNSNKEELKYYIDLLTDIRHDLLKALNAKDILLAKYQVNNIDSLLYHYAKTQK